MYLFHNMVLFEINKLNSNTYSIPINNPEFIDVLSMYDIPSKKNGITTEITCDSIVFLNKFLLDFQDEMINYDYAYAFSQNMVNQLLYLEKQKKTVHAFSVTDFIVIDKSYLIFINYSSLFEIENNSIEINSPYSKNNNLFFITSIMKNNTSLPLTIHYKNIYISLAYIIIYMMYGKHYFDYSDNHKLISNLYGTKLYYFLENCLSESEENRHICFF